MAVRWYRLIELIMRVLRNDAVTRHFSYRPKNDAIGVPEDGCSGVESLQIFAS